MLRRLKPLLLTIMKYTLLLLLSLSGIQALFSQENIIIAGQARGFDPLSPHVSIVAVYIDEPASANSDRSSHYASVQDDGSFYLNITLRYPHYFSFFYGNQATGIYAEPGDSIFLSFLADSLSPSSERPYLRELQYSGDQQKVNQIAVQYIKLANSYLDDRFDFIDEEDPAKAIEKAYNYLEEGRQHLQAFADSTRMDSFIYDLLLDEHEYNWANDMLEEGLARIIYDSLPSLPEDYYSFLDYININQPRTVGGTSYYDFIQILVGREIIQRRKKGNFRMMLTFFRPRAYYRMLKKAGLEGFGMDTGLGILAYQFISNSSSKGFMKFIRKKYYKLYMKKATYEPFKATMRALYHQKPGPDSVKMVSGNLAEITAPYAGKIVYIDFWASWCSPCIAEMPFAAEIKQKYKGEDVVFLYCSFDDREDRWLHAREGLKILGEHIRLSPKARSEISRQLKISGIPHYTLINHKGEIFMESAPRPSSIRGKGKQVPNEQLEYILNHLIQLKNNHP